LSQPFFSGGYLAAFGFATSASVHESARASVSEACCLAGSPLILISVVPLGTTEFVKRSLLLFHASP
jgi:hypothetical protein